MPQTIIQFFNPCNLTNLYEKTFTTLSKNNALENMVKGKPVYKTHTQTQMHSHEETDSIYAKVFMGYEVPWVVEL